MATLESLNGVWLVDATWWQGCRELLLQDSCFCKAVAVSQAFIFHFKCYSILHFAVCQLLRWAFLYIARTSFCLRDSSVAYTILFLDAETPPDLIDRVPSMLSFRTIYCSSSQYSPSLSIELAGDIGTVRVDGNLPTEPSKSAITITV